MQRSCELRELLSSLNQEAGVVSRWLDASYLPQPSLTTTWPDEMPSQVRAAREHLAAIAKTLSGIVSGPYEHLHELAWAPLSTSAFRWIIHHRIPQAVDLEHGSSYADIAKACNVNQADLERMVRFCTHNLIFQEPVAGHVAHTSYSAALATEKGLRALVHLNVEELANASTKLVEAQEKWPGSEESTHSPWNLAFNSDTHMFEGRLLANHDDFSQTFIDMMEYDNKQPLYDLQHVKDAFDWKSVDHVVDVGGGSGDLGLALAETYPHLHVFVADRPETVATGKDRITEAMMPRLQFVACDFFAPLPMTIANKKTFLLRRILHDWSDKFAAKIIQTLLPALKDGATMLVMDAVLPEPGSLPDAMDRIIRSLDLTMKHVLNAKERSQTEWQGLLTSVDKTLVIKSITRPDGSAMSVLEIKSVP